MRDMQRSSLRDRHIQRTHYDFIDTMEVLRNELLHEVTGPFLWTKRHGALPGSKLNAHDYGRMLHAIKTAVRAFERVTERLPANFGEYVA
jgi:hypothetical protein